MSNDFCTNCHDLTVVNDGLRDRIAELEAEAVRHRPTVDTSKWTCGWVAVPVSQLRVTKVEHEVVEWEASFCSEDAVPMAAPPRPNGVVIIDGKQWRVEPARDFAGNIMLPMGRGNATLVPVKEDPDETS